jgi:uncharacterized protein
MAADELIRVDVVRSNGQRNTVVHKLQLPVGCTVSAALQAVGWLQGAQETTVGVWGRVAPLEQVLRDQDRVELTRALAVDPKEARRLRYRKQGPRNKPAPPNKKPGLG